MEGGRSLFPPSEIGPSTEGVRKAVFFQEGQKAVVDSEWKRGGEGGTFFRPWPDFGPFAEWDLLFVPLGGPGPIIFPNGYSLQPVSPALQRQPVAICSDIERGLLGSPPDVATGRRPANRASINKQTRGGAAAIKVPPREPRGRRGPPAQEGGQMWCPTISPLLFPRRKRMHLLPSPSRPRVPPPTTRRGRGSRGHRRGQSHGHCTPHLNLTCFLVAAVVP